jgi:putative addiction module component (TIGR02574 family)
MAKPVLDIERLSADERLDLLERLWESLTREPGGVPLTRAQREDLDRRLDELDRGEVQGIPWDEVLKQIRSRSR